MSSELTWAPATTRLDLLAESTAQIVGTSVGLAAAEVTPIDPELADTQALTKHYQLAPDACANCVIVAAKRAGITFYAAALVLGHHKADVNGILRKSLAARKVSFAPLDVVVDVTGMERGGITPIGLPVHWPIYVDAVIPSRQHLIIGSGLRFSKIRLPGQALLSIPGASLLQGLGVESHVTPQILGETQRD